MWANPACMKTTMEYCWQTAWNLCQIFVLRFSILAFCCITLKEKLLSFFYHFFRLTPKLYKWNCTDRILLLHLIWHYLHISWGCQFFCACQVIPCMPSEKCWYWQTFINWIHSPSPFFFVILQQLDISQIYRRRPLQLKFNPQLGPRIC